MEVYFSQFSAGALMLAVIMINNVDKFLKKLWCCDGGGGAGRQNITILSDLNWPPSRLSKADFSSVFPSFEVSE